MWENKRYVIQKLQLISIIILSQHLFNLDIWEASDNLPSTEALTPDRYGEAMQGGDLCEGGLVLGRGIDQAGLTDAPSHTKGRDIVKATVLRVTHHQPQV